MRPAAFLDRDGVINAEVDYLHEPEKTVILPGVAAALREIRRRGYAAIVVTNQAGVARGLYPASDIDAVHERIRELLALEGAAVDAFYYCPHHPEHSGCCDCRKPEPGMLLLAAAEHGLDLARSFMVGDRQSDLDAGRAAGCAASILVRGGYGEKIADAAAKAGVPVADDLAGAVKLFFETFAPEA
jgi:D-glycero-D-manno-heptose 1,7-bisphosphate phosphatase